MKKKHAKIINDAADAIGTKQQVKWIQVPWKGSDLLLTGYGKQKDSHLIDPEETYLIDVPYITHVSTKKEMKRRFKQQGVQGVTQVVKKEYQSRFGG